MRITHELMPDSETQVMTVDVDFAKQDDQDSKPGFVMALIQFLPFENWGPYYDKNYRLEFTISSSPEITAVQLEIKDKMKNKFLDEKIPTSGEATHKFFNLREEGSIEKWLEVHQLCFTVFSHYTLSPQGSFTVTDFKLVES